MNITALDLMLHAPLILVTEDGDDTVFHGATMDAIADAAFGPGEPTVVLSACGLPGKLALIGDADAPSLWPPRVAELRAGGGSRCLECHRATGRMRPRSTIRGRDVG